MLGVSTQQVYKYEIGQNTISPSRLQTLSKLLGVPITYFFDTSVGNPVDKAIGPLIEPPANDHNQSALLLEAFERIRDPEGRALVVIMTKWLAKQ